MSWLEIVRTIWPIAATITPFVLAGGFAWLKTQFPTKVDLETLKRDVAAEVAEIKRDAAKDVAEMRRAVASDVAEMRLHTAAITDRMLYAAFYGYSVAELMWQPLDGMLQFSEIRVRHARRFRYNDDGELRLLTPRNMMRGEELPARKFWVVAAGAADDDEPYGRGLAEWLYWPTLFKRNGVRFWNNFTDRYSTPTALGKYRPGTPDSEIDNLVAALQAFSTDSGIAIPDGMAIELMHVAQGGSITNFENLCRYMDGAIAKVVLSQTMTTDDGASHSQAKVHAGVKLEVVKSDADLLSDSFNAGPARWFGVGTAWGDEKHRLRVEGGPRLVEQLGEQGAVVLHFSDDRLDNRHRDMRRLGASWDFPSYLPHVTISYVGDGIDLSQVEPYRDELVFGPEIFEPIVEGWQDSLRETSFAEPSHTLQPDQTEAAIDDLLAAEGYRIAEATTGTLLDRIAAANSEEELSAILRDPGVIDDNPLYQALHRASFALKLAAGHSDPHRGTDR